MTTQAALRPQDIEDWIWNLENSLNAHFMRVQKLLQAHNLSIEGMFVESLRTAFPNDFDKLGDWSVEGFVKMGWPLGWPLEIIPHISMESYADKLRVNNIDPDFRTKWPEFGGDAADIDLSGWDDGESAADYLYRAITESQDA